MSIIYLLFFIDFNIYLLYAKIIIDFNKFIGENLIRVDDIFMVK